MAKYEVRNKMLYIGDQKGSGVDVRYTKSRQSISIAGWYDGCVGIECGEVPLADFFQALGITAADIVNAFEKTKAQQ